MIKSILIGTAVLAVAIPAITTTYADKSSRSMVGEEFRGPDVVAWYTGGSSSVDVYDLLELIASWGDC